MKRNGKAWRGTVQSMKRNCKKWRGTNCKESRGTVKSELTVAITHEESLYWMNLDWESVRKC